MRANPAGVLQRASFVKLRSGTPLRQVVEFLQREQIRSPDQVLTKLLRHLRQGRRFSMSFGLGFSRPVTPSVLVMSNSF
jgi:hypothetical protein